MFNESKDTWMSANSAGIVKIFCTLETPLETLNSETGQELVTNHYFLQYLRCVC